MVCSFPVFETKKALVPKLFFETKAEDASAVPLKLRRPHGPPPLTGPNSPFALTRRLRRALTRRAPPRTPGSGAIGAGGLRRRFAPNTGSLRVSASVPLRHRFEGYYKRPRRFCQPLLREGEGRFTGMPYPDTTRYRADTHVRPNPISPIKCVFRHGSDHKKDCGFAGFMVQFVCF